MATELILKFTVPGKPLSKGRHRSKLMWTQKGVENKYQASYDVAGRNKGRPFIMNYPDKDTQDYESKVCLIAQEEMVKHNLLIEERTLNMRVIFYLPRPKNHYRTKKGQLTNQLHSWAIGMRPGGKPDKDNLVKAVQDAINKVVWRDDALIVDSVERKIYSTFPRTEFQLWVAEPAVDPLEIERLGIEFQETEEQLKLLEL